MRIHTATVDDVAAIAKVHVDNSRTTYALYLLVSHQGQWLGRQLMVTLVTRLIQAGIPTLLLWVLAANLARKFYERQGAYAFV